MNEEKGGNLEIPKIDVETVPTNHSSHLRNKYMEDIESKTVANNLADFIVHIEKDHENPFKRQLDDEEEMRYSDDEEENDSNEDMEDSAEENEQELDLLREIKLKSRTIIEDLTHLPNRCLHVIDIAISQLCGLMNDTEKISGEKEKVLEMKKEVVTILSNGIRCCVLKKNDIKDLDCNHVETDLSRNLKDVLDSTSDIFCARNHASETVRTIHEKARKIFVAPGEKGKFVNWRQNIFIEEMAFPALFPYGIGGYLSSNILNGSDIGFANYCRNRLLSADPKFRNDHNYLFFLLLVKELIEMKRSKATYLRKAAKHPNLTKQAINELKKENLIRTNNVFNVYKNLRGSAPYYQKAKQNLFATIVNMAHPHYFKQ